MTKKRDLRNLRFGRLTVMHEAEKRGQKARWLCTCDCGNTATVQSSNLTTGHTSSCGCVTKELQSKRATERNTIHGHNTVSYKSPTWQSWHAMMCRCYSRSHKSYPSYGGRGIVVCERWKSFVEFYKDMGDRPDGLTIERMNVNGNYEPGNCRWASASDQQRNRRDNWWKWAANENGELVRVAS